ncbi:class A beta-lactamase-related serine hydrolase [Nonomuraea mesophila]|uniref:Class A beta-lactamase-related serine hydrolase n=1 Tax=Nonomuraea mesophila TaxID=2530382 RepID=A0A4R5ER57_9ACTN|nr:serine hydrolase domain-containing protein [Nonomuraea mesophila]TDE37167.1 class A beta-lactamase-related serine hydrolase [Nonomuraea mesophila]
MIDPRVTTRRTLAGLAGLAVAGTLAAAPASAAAPSSDLQRRLDALVTDHEFPAALAAVRGRDGRTRHYTAGVADLKTEAKVPVNGQVRIASNTKMFTAVVVLQLVSEGKIKLDAPVETYLPKLLRGKAGDGRKITVRQLLQHTAGLPDYDTVLLKDYFDIQHRHYEPHDLVAAAQTQKGTRVGGWSYSNTGYVLAGLIVQQVTGRPIGEEITRRVIKPLELRKTYWPGVGEQRIRGTHPKGYFRAKPSEPYTDVSTMDPSMAWAAGALVSTPSDLNRFMVGLLDGKLLKPKQLKQMKKTVAAPQFDTTGKARYGLGIASFKLSCGGVAWSHGGSAPGYATTNAATEDGRAATIATTALPADMKSVKTIETALDRALCR